MIGSKTASKMVRTAFGVLLMTLAYSATQSAAAPIARDLGWQVFASDGFPLRFEYPSALFPEISEDLGAASATGSRRAGRIFSTTDGRAQLQVGAFDNADGLSASELRARALKTTYEGARVEYDRLSPTWFVLSGRRGEDMFYERISLTCGGRRIDVWTMNYPVAESARFDRVVEEMARRYRSALRQVRCS